MTTRGFTLIEVMVTIAIIGILAGIGWSYYSSEDQMRIRRDAVTALTAIGQKLETCRTDVGNYQGCIISQVAPSASNTKGGGNHKCGMYAYSVGGNQGSIKSPDCHYDIAISIFNNGDSYKLTATKNIANDSECKDLTLDNLGRQGYQGTATSAQHCWGN